ncbi:hypothetical protein DFP98_1509 [Cohnella phaseoli]|uniref:Uncharacterized protein n=1 Tax=Cohnella phaseoli TaxID=456490 RepID=A0A3D9HUK1_9BACL|nr:hypothetical protein DFP98_1509 [Cohnella phaseoli]
MFFLLVELVEEMHLNLENQEMLFSIFHDGSIEEIRDSVNGIEFTVDIMNLAERIKPQFRGIIQHLPMMVKRTLNSG